MNGNRKYCMGTAENMILKILLQIEHKKHSSLKKNKIIKFGMNEYIKI